VHPSFEILFLILSVSFTNPTHGIDFERLPEKVRNSVFALERATADCSGMLVNICLSYGARAEILKACNAIVKKQLQSQMREKNGQIVKNGHDVSRNGNGSSSSNSSSSSSSGNSNENSGIGNGSADAGRVCSTCGLIRNGMSSSGPASEATAKYCRCGVSSEEGQTEGEEVAGLSETNERGKRSTNTCVSADTSNGSSSSSGSGNSSSDKAGIPSSEIPYGREKGREMEDDKCGHYTEVDERMFADHLCTYGLPDPDILIRTSGETRISNFLLWQVM
jgi:Putative undecaprenyl diphosphate synthase